MTLNIILSSQLLCTALQVKVQWACLSSSYARVDWSTLPGCRGHRPRWNAASSVDTLHEQCSIWTATENYLPPWNEGPPSQSRAGDPRCKWFQTFRGLSRWRCCGRAGCAGAGSSRSLSCRSVLVLSSLWGTWGAGGVRGWGFGRTEVGDYFTTIATCTYIIMAPEIYCWDIYIVDGSNNSTPTIKGSKCPKGSTFRGR